MSDRFASLRQATADALLRGPGTVPEELRQAIAAGTPPADLAPLVEKVRSRAYTVTDRDLDVLRARYTEEQLFEIIAAAAWGAASDRLTAVHRALEGL
jgi:hypothetical protein